MAEGTSQRTPWWQGKGEPLTEEQAHHLQADLRLRLWIAAGGMVWAVAVFFALVVFNSHQHPDKPIRWPLAIGLSAAIVAATAAAVAGGVWLRSRNRSLRTYVVSGDRKSRKRVAKQLRKGQRVGEGDLGVAQATVDVSHRQRWLPLYFVGMAVLTGVSALLNHQHPTNPPRPPFLQAMQVGLPLLMLALAVYVEVTRRRMLANAARQSISPAARIPRKGRDDHS